MSTLPQPGKEYEQAPIGTHPAVCCGVIDLGTQHETYEGRERDVHQIMVQWLLDEMMLDGRPFMVSRTYTWSTHEKAALRHDLEAWRGVPFTEADFGEGGFDIAKIIGKPCLVMIGRTATAKAKVTGVAKLAKGMTAPVLKEAPVYVWLSADEFSQDAYEELTDFWRSKIAMSPEFKALMAPKPAAKVATSVKGGGGGVGFSDNLEEDEIPFATSAGIW